MENIDKIAGHIKVKGSESMPLEVNFNDAMGYTEVRDLKTGEYYTLLLLPGQLPKSREGNTINQIKKFLK